MFPPLSRRINPKVFVARTNRCRAYIDKGDYDRAISDCEHALNLNPLGKGALSNRGVAYGKKGDFGRAIADLNQVLVNKPRFATLQQPRRCLCIARRP